MTRIAFLDGLRGVAILLVLLYHAFSSRWASVLPYQDQYDYITIFHFGNYGVQLFFMVSGFVIAMTLEKCESFWSFMYRRWLRLFPAMLAATILILLTAFLFTARPYGAPDFQDAIPGLLFIEPEFFRLFFDEKQAVLEGSFWTLFVEMKFYILAGVLYFSVGSKNMILILVAMFLSTIVLEFLAPYLAASSVSNLKTWLKYLDWEYYGWFAAGALFYLHFITKSKMYWILAVLLSLVAARSLDGLLTESMVFAITIVGLFALSMFNQSIQKVLSNKVLVFFGFISYPLYLIHEQAMVSMIVQLNSVNQAIPNLLLPIVPILILVFIAWILARYIEPQIRKWIKRQLSTLKA